MPEGTLRHEENAKEENEIGSRQQHGPAEESKDDPEALSKNNFSIHDSSEEVYHPRP